MTNNNTSVMLMFTAQNNFKLETSNDTYLQFDDNGFSGDIATYAMTPYYGIPLQWSIKTDYAKHYVIIPEKGDIDIRVVYPAIQIV